MGIRPKDGWDDPPPEARQPLVHSRLQPRVYQAQQSAAQYVYLAQPQPPATYFQCKVCDRGMLAPKKLFRMSPSVVVIGFIFLIPSVIGMLISLFGILGSVASAGASASMNASSASSKREAISRMREAGVPRHVINAVLAGRTSEVDQWLHADIETNGRVTAYQAEPVRQAQRDIEPGVASLSLDGLLPHLVGISSIVFGIISFVGGLFGWLLVMRKKVLQCAVCGAVVNAC
jgi:hypothetical protein